MSSNPFAPRTLPYHAILYLAIHLDTYANDIIHSAEAMQSDVKSAKILKIIDSPNFDMGKCYLIVLFVFMTIFY